MNEAIRDFPNLDADSGHRALWRDLGATDQTNYRQRKEGTSREAAFDKPSEYAGLKGV
jgi:hypothetical protein